MSSFFKIKKSGSSKQHPKSHRDISWVLDGLVDYLQSPTWKVPIMNFIEENCFCFENKEENKLEYTDIYLKYKKLVEDLLASYTKELGISQDLFNEACDKKVSNFHSGDGSEYMWAADDYVMFKRLMIKHNLDLELQTANYFSLKTDQSSSDIKLLNDQTDDFLLINHESNMAGSIRTHGLLEQQEKEELEQAMLDSRLEMEKNSELALREKEMLEEAIRLSLLSANELPDARSTSTSKESTPPESSIPASVSTDRKSLIAPLSSEKDISSSVKQPCVEPATQTIAESHQSPKTSASSASLSGTDDSVSTKSNDDDPAVTSPSRSRKEKKPHRSSSKSSITAKSLPPLKTSNVDVSLDWMKSKEESAATIPAATDNIMNSNANNNNKYFSSAQQQQPSQSSSSTKVGPTEEEIARRKMYLKRQRDALLEQRRKEREVELQNYQAKANPGLKLSHETPSSSNLSNKAETSKDLEERRELAKKLKDQVVMKQ